MNRCCRWGVVVGLTLIPEFLGAQQIQLAAEVSRSTGVAPLAVFFDATGTTHQDGSLRPFHDLCYLWDFGDPNAGLWAESGKNKNWASGAVAAHVFESPGTFTVTITARDENGDQAVATIGVEVSDADAAGWITYYVSSSDGDDLDDGRSPSTAFETLERAFAEQGPQRRILLKRGDEWTTDTGYQLTAAGPGDVASFGTGNRPRIVSTIPDPECTVLWINAADWRVGEIEFSAAGGSSDCCPVDVGPGQDNVLVYDNDISGFSVGLGNDWSTTSDALFWIENQVSNIEVNGAYIGANRLAILGNRIGHISTSHVLRVWYMRKGVIASNFLYDPSMDNTANRLSLKLHTDIALSSDPAEFIEISDNTFRGDGWVTAIAPQDDWSDEEVRDVVVERNRFESTADTSSHILIEGHHITVRNNILDASSGGRYFSGILFRHPAALTTPVADIDVYHNTVTRADTVDGYSEFTAFDISPGVERLRFRDNILHKTQNIDWNYAFMVHDASSMAEIDSDFNLMSLASSQFASIAGDDYDLAAWQTNFGLDVSSQEVLDVVFADPYAGNVQIVQGSPAIDAAQARPVFDDFNGTPRPVGLAPDIGAFESTGSIVFIDGFEIGATSRWTGYTAP